MTPFLSLALILFNPYSPLHPLCSNLFSNLSAEQLSPAFLLPVACGLLSFALLGAIFLYLWKKDLTSTPNQEAIQGPSAPEGGGVDKDTCIFCGRPSHSCSCSDLHYITSWAHNKSKDPKWVWGFNVGLYTVCGLAGVGIVVAVCLGYWPC